MYNAFLTEFYGGDSIEAKSYLNQLVYKGLKKGYFNDTASNPTLYKFVSSEFDSFYIAGSKSKEALKAPKWDSLFLKDQSVRKEIVSDEVMRKVDSENIAKAREYILSEGFPTFENSGFWGKASGPNGGGVLWYLLWHQRPQETPIDSIVKEALLDGNFRPDDWAAILVERAETAYSPYHLKIWGDEKKLSPLQIEQVNKARNSIYLGSLQDYRRKWKIAQKNQERSQTEYNPLIYKKEINTWYQFVFLNIHLIPTTEQIKNGF